MISYYRIAIALYVRSVQIRQKRFAIKEGGCEEGSPLHCASTVMSAQLIFDELRNIQGKVEIGLLYFATRSHYLSVPRPDIDYTQLLSTNDDFQSNTNRYSSRCGPNTTESTFKYSLNALSTSRRFWASLLGRRLMRSYRTTQHGSYRLAGHFFTVPMVTPYGPLLCPGPMSKLRLQGSP